MKKRTAIKVKIISKVGKNYFCKKKIAVSDIEKTIDYYVLKLTNQ